MTHSFKASTYSPISKYVSYGNKIILTNGFVKKTQKTPPSEIRLAKKRRDDYIERQGENK